jgi:cytochrome c-type biogenesis protein CcmH
VRKTFQTIAIIGLVALMTLLAGAVLAQDGASTVTDDEVNEIASKLYCPVCENIPLDACGTAACNDWRYEIRLQLEDGMTEQQIIDDFVARFGDRVVGTPQDPVLRAMALVTPWVLAAAAAFLVFRTLTNRGPGAARSNTTSNTATLQDDLRSQLERDLNG